MAFQLSPMQNQQGGRKRRNIANRVQRGVIIPDQDNDFFNTVTDEVKFSSGEHRVVLAQEILAYIRRKETRKFFQNQCASRVLDNLLPFANQHHFEFLSNMVMNNSNIFFKDMYASFLVQNLLKTCLHRNLMRFKASGDLNNLSLMPRCSYNLNTIFGSAHVQFCGEFVLRSAQYVKTNVADLAVNGYGTHVVRTVLCCLVGLDNVILEAETRGLTSYNEQLLKMRKICTTPKLWLDHFYEIVDALVALPNFTKMADDTKLSGVLQCMVKCFSAVNATERLTKFIEVFFGYTPETKEARFQVIFGNQPRLNLLESVMATLTTNNQHELFKSLVESLFVGRFKTLSLDKQMKFPAQHAIEHCQDKALFDVIFGELVDCLDEVFASGNLNVIIELAKACRHRFVDKQDDFVAALQKVLHCPDPESMFHPLLKLQKFDQQDKLPLMIREQGAQIFQQLLFFAKMWKPLVDKLTGLKHPEMIQILFDKSGTQIFHSLFHNERIEKDKQEWFMRQLTGRYAEMASSKFCKKTFLGIYNSASPAYQVLIVYELAQGLNELRKTQNGRVIAAKLSVEAFAAGMKAWRQARDERDKNPGAYSDADSCEDDGETWTNFN